MKLYDRPHMNIMWATNLTTLALLAYWFFVQERDPVFWCLAAVDATLWLIFIVMDLRRRF